MQERCLLFSCWCWWSKVLTLLYFFVFSEPEEKLIRSPWCPAAMPVKLPWCVIRLKKPKSGSLTRLTDISQSLLNVTNQFCKCWSLCQQRTQVIVPFLLLKWLFNCCPIRYLCSKTCHFEARLLNPLFLAFVRHFLALTDESVCSDF